MKFLFLLFLFPLISEAKPLPIEGLKCQRQLAQMTTSFEIESDWKRLLSTNPSLDRFSVRTKTLGKWVYLERDSVSQNVVLSSQSQFEMLTIEMDERCEKKISYKIIDEDRSHLNDSDLKHLVDTYSDVIVYIWSPEMPLSIRTLPEIKKFAEKENILLKVYLYPLSSVEAAERTVASESYPREYLKKLNSFELSMAGVEAHQPALFRYKKGVPYGMPLFGFKTENEYVNYYSSLAAK
jgi:hypothetical protein